MGNLREITTRPERWCVEAAARCGPLLAACAILVAGAAASEVCAPVCQTDTAGNLTTSPSNCTQYYACEYVDDQVVAVGPYSCAFYEYFDDVVKECLSIEAAPLGYCTSPCSPCDPLCDTPGEILPDPLNCTKYYVCLNTGELLSLECGPGELFDYTHFNCTDSGGDDRNCFTFCDECETYCAGVGQVERDPLDCAAYYLCEPPYKVHKVCPAEQLFDPDTGECSDTAVCDTSCFVY